jgi:hypothetical protein
MHFPLKLTEPSDRQHLLDTQGSLLPISFTFIPGEHPSSSTDGYPAFLYIEGDIPAGTLRLVDPRHGELLEEIEFLGGTRDVAVPLTPVRQVLPEGTQLLLIVDDSRVSASKPRLAAAS